MIFNSTSLGDDFQTTSLGGFMIFNSTSRSWGFREGGRFSLGGFGFIIPPKNSFDPIIFSFHFSFCFRDDLSFTVGFHLVSLVGSLGIAWSSLAAKNWGGDWVSITPREATWEARLLKRASFCLVTLLLFFVFLKTKQTPRSHSLSLSCHVCGVIWHLFFILFCSCLRLCLSFFPVTSLC